MTYNPNGPHDLEREYAKDTEGSLSPDDLSSLQLIDYHPEDVFDNDEALEEYHQLLKLNAPHREQALAQLEELRNREYELIYSKTIKPRGVVRANNEERLDLY